MGHADWFAKGFQSTLSVRRATRTTAIHGQLQLISIHALREESDLHRWTACFTLWNIYPSYKFKSSRV